MIETGDNGGGAGFYHAVTSRLVAFRWVLAASAAAILAIGAAGQVRPLYLAGAIAAVVLTVLVAPRLSSRQRRSADNTVRKPGIESLTAAYLADAVLDPLLLIDENGTLIHANEAALRAFGKLSAGTLVQLRFRAPEMQELIGRLMAGKPGPHQTDYAERVPIERWFRVSGKPVGERTGLYVLMFRDMSEVRRIDRMRADFIANASHELRTPLASIAGFIETIRGPARNDKAAQENFLQIMQNQTERMARLIDDLLSLSRLETKPYLALAQEIDIRNVVKGVIDALSNLAADCGVIAEKHIPDMPIMVRGDADELIQVFQNLLENACKYGQSGGRVVVRIEGGGEGADEGARVAITDFGPGIPAEHIPRITERFYRVDVETSRSQKGTGLGLAIVKHILTRHGARLSIKSEVGKGATFEVHFPPT